MKQRIITGVVFGIMVIGLVFLSDYSRLALTILVGCWSLYELLSMARLSLSSKIIRVSLAALLCLLSFYRPLSEVTAHYLTAALCLFHIILIANLYIKNNSIINWMPALSLLYPAGSMILLASHLAPFSNDHMVIMITLLFIWSSDTFAYFSGKTYGKHKLFPSISPNKTWEGTLGGGVMTILLAFILSFFLKEVSTSILICLATICWVGGSYGDLVQSSIKRNYQVKDSGNVLPGHGGIFDRFDSFIFVIPFVYLFLQFIMTL